MPKFNPLLDSKKSVEMTASNNSGVPLSPISNKPMQAAFCKNVPVWIDTRSRLVMARKVD